MSLAAHSPVPDDAEVLAKATLRAGKALGFTQAEVGEIIGRDRASLRRALDPASKPGELALLLIRVYRSLHALVGGNEADLRHWMAVFNHHTGGVPREQARSVSGLVGLSNYLDAMRGR